MLLNVYFRMHGHPFSVKTASGSMNIEGAPGDSSHPLFSAKYLDSFIGRDFFIQSIVSQQLLSGLFDGLQDVLNVLLAMA